MAFLDPDLERDMMAKPDLSGPFHPTGGRILLRPDPEPEGRIKLSVGRPICRGVVVEVSIDRDKKGRTIPSELAPGDRVLFDPKAPMPMLLDGIEHLLIHSKFVLAKVLEDDRKRTEDGL